VPCLKCTRLSGAFLHATRLALALILASVLTHSLGAQAAPPSTASANDSTPPGIIPAVNGPNLSLVTASQHDSSAGWSSVLTPDFAFRFNKHFSADTNAPFYAYVNVIVTTGTKAVPTYTNATKHYIFGDMAINGHYDLEAGWLTYGLTTTLGLPTGKSNEGLGAGQVTYNFNNHFEHDYDFFSPDIEIGIGDNSSLVSSPIRKSYVSVGTLAYFQAGGSFDLHKATFETDAYEELPIDAQTLYSTTGKGKKKVTTATGTSIAEDNGFLNTLDIPLNGHITVSGFYNRSLRNKIDTVGFSFTFLLKAPPKPAEH